MGNCRFGKSPTLSEEKSHVDGFMTSRNILSALVLTIDRPRPVSWFICLLMIVNFAEFRKQRRSLIFQNFRRQLHRTSSIKTANNTLHVFAKVFKK